MEFNEDILKEAVKGFLDRTGYEKIELKAALIDMDGVLYDSMKNHTAAWYRMATELGIDCERDEFYLYEGMTGVATINLLFGRAFNRQLSREEAQELYKTKAKYFVELGSPELMPGATKMLNVLKDNDIERVLVTGSGQKSVLDKIDCDYPGIFKETNKVTALDVINGKPNPEPYLKGLGLVGLKPNQAIVVENAPLGIKAGSAAGCFTIGITTGPIPEKEMWNSGANLVFPSMPAFTDNIEIIIKNLK